MNDPHVESLEYRFVVATDSPIAFKSDPLDHETEDFTLHLERGRLAVSMKTHHATEKDAREQVERLLRSWEVDQALPYGRRVLRFDFEDAKIIDRKPSHTGGVIGMAGEVNIAGQIAVLRVSRQYPLPPVDFVASTNVLTLWNRYEQYVEGHDRLAGMAWFCFNTAVPKGPSEASSKSLNICRKVLKKLKDLAGGRGERKLPSQGPYSAQEKEWLEAAIRMLIRRVGEIAAEAKELRKITMADLPKL
jgi:hypothetical protein